MNSKSSNIIKWAILGVLILITLVFAGLFYANIGKDAFDSSTNMILNWGYILILLGVVIAVISAIVAIIIAILRGVPRNKVISIGVVAVVLVALAIVAKFISKDMIETELNFFYLTFGFSIVAMLFSLIYKAIKR